MRRRENRKDRIVLRTENNEGNHRRMWGYERIVPKQTHIHAGKYATAHLYSLCGKHRPAGQLQNIISKREKEEKNHEKNSSSCTLRSNDAYRCGAHPQQRPQQQEARQQALRQLLPQKRQRQLPETHRSSYYPHTASAKISPKKRFTHRLRTSSAVRSLLRQAAQTTVIQS